MAWYPCPKIACFSSSQLDLRRPNAVMSLGRWCYSTATIYIATNVLRGLWTNHGCVSVVLSPSNRQNLLYVKNCYVLKGSGGGICQWSHPLRVAQTMFCDHPHRWGLLLVSDLVTEKVDNLLSVERYHSYFCSFCSSRGKEVQVFSAAIVRSINCVPLYLPKKFLSIL